MLTKEQVQQLAEVITGSKACCGNITIMELGKKEGCQKDSNNPYDNDGLLKAISQLRDAVEDFPDRVPDAVLDALSYIANTYAPDRMKEVRWIMQGLIADGASEEEAVSYAYRELYATDRPEWQKRSYARWYKVWAG